jgi:hypothetical protein
MSWRSSLPMCSGRCRGGISGGGASAARRGQPADGQQAETTLSDNSTGDPVPHRGLENRCVPVHFHAHAVWSADRVPERVAHEFRGDQNGVVHPLWLSMFFHNLAYMPAREASRLGAVGQLHPMAPYRGPPEEALLVHQSIAASRFPPEHWTDQSGTGEPRRHATLLSPHTPLDGGRTAYRRRSDADRTRPGSSSRRRSLASVHLAGGNAK